MAGLDVGAELPLYEVTANNYAEDSDNKIHSDDVASEYGFRGGLVPGVGVYAYMTVPVVEALGRDWLESGDMTAKFIKPVYHDEIVRVRAKVAAIDPIRIIVTAENESGELCALGEASYSDAMPQLDFTRYILGPPPKLELRYAPSLDLLRADMPLGALVIPWVEAEIVEPFLNDVVESLPLYQTPEVTWHPGILPHLANQVLVENIALGPWIHTASDVDHYALPEPGEEVLVRSRIINAYEKRGHEIVTIDIAFTGAKDRTLAFMTHTAIVKPAKATA